MDPASTSGVSLDGVIFALFLLAISGLCGMVMVYGSNIRKDIAKLFDKMDEHSTDDTGNFKEINRRVDRHAQRLTKLDGRTEDA